MNLVIASIFIGNLVVTSYRSVPNQTDSSPYYTSIGEHVHPHGIAVSRNLLKRWGGPLDYGDLIYVEDVGFKVVNDCMAERHVNKADVWVETLQDEKRFYHRFKGRSLKIWLIRRKEV